MNSVKKDSVIYLREIQLNEENPDGNASTAEK